MTKQLTPMERREVEHWRLWARSGQKLNYAPIAINPLIAIIDRLTREELDAPTRQTE